MSADVAELLPKFTLAARKLLVDEISEQLEGIYGFLPEGALAPAGQYPALAGVPEAAETRRRLENLLADEGEAGLSPADARVRLIKETAFTWLNRLVAFKMLEARKLLKQTISRGADSNGFKLWLTEPGREDDRRDYELGDLPQDVLGEGPRQRAYRRFLLAQCARLAEEIRVLFDPDSLASRLCPRPAKLRELIELASDEELKDAWQAGNEDTIGWVLQYDALWTRGFRSLRGNVPRRMRQCRLARLAGTIAGRP